MKNLPLPTLTNAVLGSGKYREICPDLVTFIGTKQLDRQKNLKTATKATKNKLHQIGGAYWQRPPDYTGWLKTLQSLYQSADRQAFADCCQEIAKHHASSQERLPILNQFYGEIFQRLPPIHSLVDIACGLNPLILPREFLAPDVQYFACDIYQDLTDFLQQFLALTGMAGGATCCNILQTNPREKIDLALVLKLLPCLEQLEKHSGMALLERIQSPFIVVSFPMQSLGGKEKGMGTNYSDWFTSQVAEKNWDIELLQFPTELVFLVRKGSIQTLG